MAAAIAGARLEQGLSAGLQAYNVHSRPTNRATASTSLQNESKISLCIVHSQKEMPAAAVGVPPAGTARLLVVATLLQLSRRTLKFKQRGHSIEHDQLTENFSSLMAQLSAIPPVRRFVV